MTHTIRTDDGVGLHAEVTGTGTPLLFIHEFAGDHRSWEPQVRFFSRAYQCITYAARGYPPSDAPDDPAAYGQDRAVADAVAVLDGAGVQRAHVVGLSMGGFAALHLLMRYPGRVLSAVAAGVGYGAPPERQAPFRAECEANAAALESAGWEQVAPRYAEGPARLQFKNADSRGWAEFAGALAALGASTPRRRYEPGRVTCPGGLRCGSGPAGHSRRRPGRAPEQRRGGAAAITGHRGGRRLSAPGGGDRRVRAGGG